MGERYDFLIVGSGAGGAAAAYRLAKVEQGPLVTAVSTTGTVNAVTTVTVGSQLSGQIKELMADFNSEVKAGQMIAKLDQSQLLAKLSQAEADKAAGSSGGSSFSVPNSFPRNPIGALLSGFPPPKRKGRPGGASSR